MREKQEIILGAKRIFERYGYKKTTLNDIGKEVGLNKASLYHYFKNKEDIFINVVLFEFKKYKESLDALSSVHPIQDRVNQVLEHQVRFFLDKSLLSQAIELNFNSLSAQTIEKVKEMRAIELHFMISLIDQGKKSGEIKDIESQPIATALFLLSEGFKRFYKSQNFLLKDASALPEALHYLKSSITLIFDGIATHPS